MKQDRYYAMSTEEVYQNLQTTKEGLSEREAQRRLEKYGKNELPKKEKDSIFVIILRELRDPIVLLLVVAIMASLMVGEITDAIAILIIILIDLIIGTYEEYKANTTIESLEELVAETSKVIRDEQEKEIPSEYVTVGDYILLESGDKISADLRIVESHNLTIDESILTGESVPVEKNSKKLANQSVDINVQCNMLFAGTTVITGRAKALVVKVGLETEIGKIATTIHNSKEEKSPLTIRIEKFSAEISTTILFLSLFLAMLLYMKGMQVDEILVSTIALAVSAMPEGLPLALTMALTIASNKTAEQKVVAKTLNAVESLGSCTVIASDKTGTLTVNEQTAKKIVLPNGLEYMVEGTGYHVDGGIVGKNISAVKPLIELGVINNEAKFSEEQRIGDSIDLAFLVLGEKMHVKVRNTEILETIPYESQNKYSAVFYKKNDETFCTIKGSTEVVASFCKGTNIDRVINQAEELSKDGYRVIALANGPIKEKEDYEEEDIKNLEFIGLVGFIDPVRKEAIPAIKKCRMAGIKVLMITGDHPLTSFKIAKDLKLVTSMSEVTTGGEVEEILKADEQKFDEFIRTKKVFARVTPLQKLKIVESLKRQGEFVAVTGDGVNDAPALQAANIGIAMGSGTDIAKETSRMIVLDDNFKSIVSGVEEGRVAYANIRKITYFLVSCGLAEVLFFILSILFNMPMPLVAIQLLWLNMVTDGIQDISLSFEKAEQNVMKEPPRSPKESLFDHTMIDEIILSGFLIGGLVFALWIYLLNVRHLEVVQARGYVMAFMIILQNIHAFNCRSEKKSAFEIPLRNNMVFAIGVLGSLLLGIAVIEVDVLAKFLKTSFIPLPDLAGLLGLGLIILLVMECYKRIKYPTQE